MMTTTTTTLETVRRIAVDTKKDEPTVLANTTVSFHNLPSWMQQDPLVTRAYRMQQHSYRACLGTLWYLHNETVNIWSHLSIGILFLCMFIWAWFPSLHGGASFATADVRAVQVYLGGATLCCGLSAWYHCTSCHSKRVAERCLKLDYLGIMFNITSTCISAAYFGLHDQPTLANRYITLIFTCGLIAFGAVLDPSADGPKAAKFRAAVFIALGASGFAPIVHAATSPALNLRGFSLEYVVAQSIAYLLGTAIYVIRFPEKYWTSVFDVWGASHQIFHVLVNVAQILHLLGLRQALLRYSQT